MIIAFEGIDGSGKTTQAKLLEDYLYKEYLYIRGDYLTQFEEDRFKKITIIHEPGGSYISKVCHQILNNNWNIDPLTELFLFSASRSAMFDYIKGTSGYSPNTESLDSCYIFDRYIFSTHAYQMVGNKIDETFLKNVLYNTVKSEGYPTFTIYLRLSKEDYLERFKEHPQCDNLGMKAHANATNIINNYDKIISKIPSDDKIIVDATDTIDNIQGLIRHHVSKKISDLAYKARKARGFYEK